MLSGRCSRGLRDDDDDAVEEGDDGDSERASDAALDVGDANGMLRLLARASVEAGIDARSATRLFLEADAVLTAARRTRAVSSKVLTDGGAKVVTIAPGPFAVAAPPDEPLPGSGPCPVCELPYQHSRALPCAKPGCCTQVT